MYNRCDVYISLNIQRAAASASASAGVEAVICRIPGSYRVVDGPGISLLADSFHLSILTFPCVCYAPGNKCKISPASISIDEQANLPQDFHFSSEATFTLIPAGWRLSPACHLP